MARGKERGRERREIRGSGRRRGRREEGREGERDLMLIKEATPFWKSTIIQATHN